MATKYTLLDDLHAADLGFGYQLGLLHRRGEVLENLLPEVEDALLKLGKIKKPEEEPKAKPAPAINKLKPHPGGNKRK